MLTIIQKHNHVITSFLASEAQLSLILNADFFENPQNLTFSQYQKQSFSPYDYGLVMIDCDTQWIGSLQRYLPLNYISSLKSIYFNTVQFQKLWEKGYFKKGVFINQNGEFSTHLFQEKQMDLNAILNPQNWNSNADNLNQHSHLNSLKLTRILFEPTPWTIQSFNETPEGYADLAFALLNKNVDVFSCLEDWEKEVQRSFLNASCFRETLKHHLQKSFSNLPQALPKSTKFI